VFLVADAADSTLSYLALADGLDTTRPVLGLEPRGVDGARIEEIAAFHVETLTGLQAEGPYTIGGWSFGAVVAHEMAGQLARRGARVDLLVCLDAYMPGQAGRRVGADPAFVLGHLRLMAWAALGVGEAGAQARRNPALRGLLLDKFRALTRYRPRPVSCPTAVFKVGVGAGQAVRLRLGLEGLYGPDVTVVPAAGEHWSMLREPHVGDLAAKLGGLLADDSVQERHDGE
jgi:phthiocerol/phenolphthiocerol synthesis type-I polyketide synthase E